MDEIISEIIFAYRSLMEKNGFWLSLLSEYKDKEKDFDKSFENVIIDTVMNLDRETLSFLLYVNDKLFTLFTDMNIQNFYLNYL